MVLIFEDHKEWGLLSQGRWSNALVQIEICLDEHTTN